MIKKYLIKVWQIGEMSLLEERIIEVEDDKSLILNTEIFTH